MSLFDNLDGQGVVVTGGADGIGLALARAFQAAGARVFLVDVNADKLASASADLGASSAICDVRDPAACARTLAEAEEAIGPLRVLCANAGVAGSGPLLEAKQAEIDWHFEVNVWGILNVCRPFVETLRKDTRSGHILMTGSECSLSYPDYLRGLKPSVYTMSKHAVFALADGLRSEVEADEVGVSLLCPGPVSTQLQDSSAASRAARLGTEDAPTNPRPPATRMEDTDPVLAQRVAQSSQTPDQVAEAALAGLRQGLFVIPTHPETGDDVRARAAEIERGLSALSR